MDTFESYDLFRLTNYKKRKKEIEFGSNEFFSYYHFDEVDYFNYIFFKSNEYNKTELDKIFKKYLKSGRDHVKIIIPLELKQDFNYILDSKSKIKEIVCVKREYNQKEIKSINNKTLKYVESWDDLLLFTRLYLKGFDSKNINYEDVALNFKLLLYSKKIDFFFIMYHDQIAGICGNFYNDNNVFLCACAVLNEYRDKGLQKKSIAERIAIGGEKGYTFFNSWAYTDSISHRNLLKSNFKNYMIYAEGLSKYLEDIIK